MTPQWPMTSLLDMLKETDFRVGFTDTFKSPTAWETMDRVALQPRLLLCLYGLGTNAGLKRMNAEEHGASYKDLLYVRRRFGLEKVWRLGSKPHEWHVRYCGRGVMIYDLHLFAVENLFFFGSGGND
jgi:hypothetical protein